MELAEKEKQIEIINRLKERFKNKDQYFFIETFGCQMNAHDSEKFAGILKEIGFNETKNIKEADLILINTCCIRDSAERKVYGRFGLIKKLRETKRITLCVCGCMMQQEAVIEEIKTKYRKIVNIAFGTHNLYKFPELLERYIDIGSQIIDIWKEHKEIVEDMYTERKYKFKACVNIMYGCNNFCTYCIVPFTRGREISRPVSDIIDEIKSLADDGVIEVMLLGQNVNSYGSNSDVSFADLLKEVAKVEKIKRIRFMTSHPKDCSDDLIKVIKTEPKVCNHIHLPVQSGSTKVLKDMNRVYTKEDYLKLVQKIRERVPDISLTTDIIVGFPGETDEDFNETIDVLKRVRYDVVYSFIYSKRTGTKAATMEGQIEKGVSSKRFKEMLEVVHDIVGENSKKRVSKVYEVLVEEKGEEGEVSGRTCENILVHMKGDETLIGSLVNVKIIESKGFYLIGEIIS